MESSLSEIEKTVLNVHRRNGGALQKLDLNLRLLDPVLLLDSLDLAEIMVEIEKQHHCSPFDASTPPRTGPTLSIYSPDGRIEHSLLQRFWLVARREEGSIAAALFDPTSNNATSQKRCNPPGKGPFASLQTVFSPPSGRYFRFGPKGHAGHIEKGVYTKSFYPGSLEELFSAFECLERGEDVLLHPGSARKNTEDVTQQVSVRIESQPEAQCRGSGGSQPRLGLSSSGSTGQPKLIWRAWMDLLNEISVAALWKSWTWASPYDPNTFAGVQVALQAWVNEGKVISLKGNCDAAWDLLQKNHVQALACTPTFIDLLIQSEMKSNSRWQPEQITLGGEVLRCRLGTRLRNRFPATRFTLIYATTELGIVLKTHRLDGWYELNWLEDHSIRWRLDGETLEIQKGDSWRTTGDKVEIKGGLIRVAGRADAVANVAGTKVDLTEVSDLAEAVPGVRRALAVAEPNLITGQIVCLKYAIDPDFDEREVTRSLKLHLHHNLQKPAWPRRWDLDPLEPVRNAKRAVR